MYRSMRGATKQSERVFCVYERCLRIRLRPRQHRSPADKAQQGLPCWVCATVVPRRCGRIGKTIAVSCAAQPSWSRLVYGAYPPPCGPCGLHIPALTAKFPEIGEALEYGHFGVPIFFVLSRLVIYLSLDGKAMTLPSVGWYYGAPICPTRSPNIGSLRGWDRSHLREREYTSRSVRLSSIFFYTQELLGYK
jgi:hypothetical protein